MTQQSTSSPAFSVSSLLWLAVGAGIVAVIAAAIIGGPTLGVAPEFSVGLVGPLVCTGGRVQYTAYRQSYQHPGESTPHVECFAADGTHRDVTGQSIFTFFGALAAVVFVPVFVSSVVAGRRPTPNRPAQAIPPAARPTTPAPSNSTAIAHRLDTLEALRAEGKITPHEYEEKRQDILSSI